MTLNNYLACSLIALTACGFYTEGDRDVHTDPTEPTQPAEPPPPEPRGTYQLRSTIALPPGALQGHAGYADTFLAMTDDPHDPATWILDRVEDTLSWPYDDALGYARDALDLDASMNALILQYAPEIVTDLVELGNDLDALARELRFEGTLVVHDDGTADLTLTHIVYATDAGDVRISLAELGLPPIEAPAIELTAIDGQATLGAHAFALPYGALLDAGIAVALLPDRDAADLTLSAWLADRVHCTELGDAVEDVVEVGSNATYANACRSIVDAAVTELTGPLFTLEADVLIDSGTATLTDPNTDGLADTFTAGTWTGTLALDTDTLQLAQTSSFDAVR